MEGQQLQREIERLRILVESSKLINSSIEGDSLYQSILSVVRQNLGVERGTLFFVDHAAEEVRARIAPEGGGLSEIRLALGRGLAGTVAATGKSVILNDPYGDPRFDPSVDVQSGFRTRSILCAPIRNREKKVVGVLQLLNKIDSEFGAPDLEFLEALSEHMAIAIENAQLHHDQIVKNRMERELQLGREIQARLLPMPPDDLPDTELVASCESCYEVGGDFYDFLRFADGDLGLALGDVSGKGVSAALVTSSLQAALRMAAPVETELGPLVGRLNSLVHGLTRARKYVTFFLGRYRPQTGELVYVNAGHLPPILCGPDGVRELPSTGKPIGLFPGLEWREERVVLPRGATLLIYSDGFTEAMSPAGEELGDERWEELVRASAERPLAELCGTLRAAVTRHEAGAEPGDDKTLVALRRR